MRRRTTAEAFLQEAGSITEKLDFDSWVDQNRAPIPLNQVKIFQAITTLKKSLEALAGDAYETAFETVLSNSKKAAGKKGSAYGAFPYGQNENDFRSRVGNIHPKLWLTRSDIYDLFESVQPYRIGRPTIYTLCESRNHIEHDNIDQTVTSLAQTIVNIGNGFFTSENSTNVIFEGNTINGKRAPDVRIDSTGQIGRIVGDKSMVSVEKKSSVTLTDLGDTDLLELLKDSYQIINELKDQAYRIM